MLESGIIVLFLVPGLMAYCALYGLFHNGKAIAPEPPSANSVEAVTVILLASITVHAVTAGLFTANNLVCTGSCPFDAPATWLDPYRPATSAIANGTANGSALTFLLMAVIVQGLVAYVGLRSWLVWLARRNRLPAWIYGWARELANSLDDDDSAILAYVLTNTDQGDRTVAYGGLLYDLALKPDGCVSRITLVSCDRYLVDLSAPLENDSLSAPLSQFAFMVIDSANIRNIAFEALYTGE